MKGKLLALSVALSVSGCAQSDVTIPPTAPFASPSSMTTAASIISITIPQAQQTASTARHAAYISTATNSMVLAPQGQTPIMMPLTTTTPGCRTLNGARICTFRISLPTGAYSMRVALYATADGTGLPLAIVSTTTTIVPDTTNNVDFTLNAVVSSLTVSLSPDNTFTASVAGSRTINVGVFDPAGATIVVGTDLLVDANGIPVTIVLSDSDSSGVTSISPTVVGATVSSLSYDGGTPNATAITAVARNASGVAVASAQTPFVVASVVCTAALLSAGGAPICTPPQRFLASPLDYSQGVYTKQIMYTVLDHSMKLDASNMYNSYSVPGDHNIVAFNGEWAHGEPGSDPTCIPGALHLATTPGDPTTDMVIQGYYQDGKLHGACPPNYGSYDEHPGYDYTAVSGTAVKAAAAGMVVNNGAASDAAARCIPTAHPGGCDAWGFVGIDHGIHGNPAILYVSQYGHLSQILVKPGVSVLQGQLIGFSGNTAPPARPVGYHLHFEVLAHIPGRPFAYSDASNWAVVDPYGWTGGSIAPYYPPYPLSQSGDPLYSHTIYGIDSRQLWQ